MSSGRVREENRLHQRGRYCQNEKEKLLYSVFRGNTATQYRLQMESIVTSFTPAYRRSQLDCIEVQVIWLTHGWQLRVYPDGLAYDPVDALQLFGLVEFKNRPMAKGKIPDSRFTVDCH